MSLRRVNFPWVLLLVAALFVAACGDRADDPVAPTPPDPGGPQEPPRDEGPPIQDEPSILEHVASLGQILMTASALDQLPPAARETLAAALEGLKAPTASAELTIDYPPADAVFPPELVPPTLLWHDDAPAVDMWLVDVALADGTHRYAFVAGPAPAIGEIEQEAMSPTNEVYMGTPYQQSARSWVVDDEFWATIKGGSIDAPATLSITGLSHKRPEVPVSRGTIQLTTSKDPVGAPIFYRDVPLMPIEGKKGLITPLAKSAMPLIRWRLRDLSKPRSRVVLRDMPTCANCHSFSLDGKTMGMDVDGPHGDKGTYLLSPVEEEMVVEQDDIISWNDYPDKPDGHKTIGFLSRVSPDGRYTVTTLNESLYVANFINYKFLQVFYPTRGILAFYDAETKEMKPLPGADDTAYVHTNGVWSPDGKWIVFSRAKAMDPYRDGQELAGEPNDPLEPQLRYDLVRIPFNEGKGGTPELVEGASANGMSNTFPKISPDGKWIVYTKCKNGQLMRPDGRLWIVPFEGGEARDMACNTTLMNSWHSFSPNGRWMVFSSKVNTPYTQMFLTHLDEDGNSTPPILVPDSTAANRAVNIPEFLNRDYEDLREIRIPGVKHHRHFSDAVDAIKVGDVKTAIALLQKALDEDPGFLRAHLKRGDMLVKLARFKEALPHYLRVLEEEPGNVMARLPAAGLLARLGRHEEALEHYRIALASEPPGGPASGAMYGLLRQRGLKLSAAGDVDGAVASMREALTISPEDTQVREELLDILMRARREVEGREVMRELIALRPQDARGLTVLAWRLAAHPDAGLRDPEEARTRAQEAVRISQGREAGPLDALAAAYAAGGRYEEAIETAEKALAIDHMPKRLRAAIQARLVLYRDGKPFVSEAP